MPDTLRLALSVPDDGSRGLLVAELSDLGFDAFEEMGDTLVAYAPAPRWDDVARETVGRLLRAWGETEAAMVEEVVVDRDWNAEWESSIQPIEAGPFVIAPTWAEIQPEHDGKVVLRIDPKMAFGTGYHESTRLVLRLLPDAVPRGARVLDVGTGTGVLAIAALRLGASSAVGVDIDPWSVTNAQDNSALNDVEQYFQAREGSLDVVPEAGFDLVMANIIRSVLEPMLPGLVSRAAPRAPIILAGLLSTERDHMLSVADSIGLSLAEEVGENEWWACSLRRDD